MADKKYRVTCIIYEYVEAASPSVAEYVAGCRDDRYIILEGETQEVR